MTGPLLCCRRRREPRIFKIEQLDQGCVASAAAVAGLAARLNVEMPIVASVDAVLHRGMAIARLIDGLLARPHRAE